MTFEIRDGYGYGIILLSVGLANELMPGAKISDTTTMGELATQGVLAQVHRNLLLPERYTVLGIFLQYYRGLWSVMVEAPIEECPRVDPGAYLPNIAPIYRIGASGIRFLERLDVETRHPEERVLRID
jgi:hypothetical protein